MQNWLIQCRSYFKWTYPVKCTVAGYHFGKPFKDLKKGSASIPAKIKAKECVAIIRTGQDTLSRTQM